MTAAPRRAFSLAAELLAALVCFAGAAVLALLAVLFM
jgi:hypothetical protein